MSLTSVARLLNLRRGLGRIRRKANLPPMIFVTDAKRIPDPAPVIERLPAGTGVIFRHYGSSKRMALAERLAAICRRRRLILIIGNDGHLAYRRLANGVHFSESALRNRLVLRRKTGIVTAAAHSFPALIRAARFGADAAVLGPVFATESHPGRPVLGPIRFADLARRSPIPVYALGGITAANARRLLGTRAIGLAALGAFLTAAPGTQAL